MTAIRPIGTGKLVATMLFLAAWPIALLWLAGDWAWWQGWSYVAWLVGLTLTTLVWLRRHNPGLLAERYRTSGTGGQKGWDRWAIEGIRFGYLAWFILIPLDARRWGASPIMPWWVEALGGALLVISAFFFFRAFTDNAFLSPLVRMQHERGHHVVSTGVYAIVRHPMYLGAVLMFVGAPLLMGSLAGLAVAVALTLILAVRILGEEKMLVTELEGYAAYREQVRWRLLPFVW